MTYQSAAPPGLAVVAVQEDGPVAPELQALAPTPAELLEPLTSAAILFTSGTTSMPKGVVITQANYAFAGDVMSAAARLAPTDRFLVVLPLFHANAQYYCFAAAIASGASVALVGRFSASRFLQQAADHGATHLSLFAAPIRMILRRGGTPIDGLRIRHAWYAQRLTADDFDAFARLIGCRPREIYGMTETIAAVLSSPPTAGWTPAVGAPTLGCSVGLLQAPDAGASGEIAVRGRRGVELFAGYLDDPTTTEGTYDGEWMKTGDLAIRSPSGQYTFTGRRGEFLKVAGENVSVIEVEAAVAEHPAVAEVAVVGRPDPIRDEVPFAFCVLHPGATVTSADLLAWCVERLSPAKRPADIAFIDTLPRTSVGKVKKFLLKPP
jgi:crotonobetaine/carnitine-CoA ligase